MEVDTRPPLARTQPARSPSPAGVWTLTVRFMARGAWERLQRALGCGLVWTLVSTEAELGPVTPIGLIQYIYKIVFNKHTKEQPAPRNTDKKPQDKYTVCPAYQREISRYGAPGQHDPRDPCARTES